MKRPLAIWTLASIAAVAALGGAAPAPGTTSEACVPNAIACENAKPGTPPSEWDVSGAGDASIQGFATDISVNHGETVRFKVKTDAAAYHIDIYRLGWYGGLGARKVATVEPSAPLPQTQPDCLNDAPTGLIDCGTWNESASWDVPGDAVSGVYVARPERADTGGDSHIVFVVRDDDGGSDLLFQTSDTTWQAYNRYGGNSLYVGAPAGRAYKVSYNRPFTTRAYANPSWLFGAEYPAIRWLERNGYDVSYFTGVDTERRGGELLEHEAFLSVGHDEYWSAGQRASVEAARDAGVHLAFLSGNEIYWKTRWEASADGSNTSFRSLVSYKETKAGAKIDPDPAWTGTWRDKRFSPPSDGGRPENALTGTLFTVDAYRLDALTVPAAYGDLRFWRNTGVDELGPGETATFAAGTLGHEWDEDVDNGVRPGGLVRLSETTLNVEKHLVNEGTTFVAGTATHSLTLYRAGSGALVFGAGTVQWTWGLDGTHDYFLASTPRSGSDRRLQQATVNLLADMEVQPATLQTDLVAATASSDASAPVSEITSPQAGAIFDQGAPVTVAGIATDTGTGVPAAVEVSIDGGQTWRPATGRSAWSYQWTPNTVGAVTIKSRAIDDSGNVEAPSTGVTVQILCPCTLWSPAARPAIDSSSDTKAVELGLKFRADQDGFVRAIRFYKGSRNTGTHVGSLWTAGGTLLSRGTFTGESAAGWQQMTLDLSVAVTANTTYVVSYFAPVGGWSSNANYFTSGLDKPPLHAPSDAAAGGQGVFRYSATPTFPNQANKSTNYWVDVVFHAEPPVDTSPPQVVAVVPAAGDSTFDPRADVTATFNEALDPATVVGTSFELRDAANALVPATVTYSVLSRTATLRPTAPLAYATTYTATVLGGTNGPADPAGNRPSSDYAWTFTTSPRPTCPCSLWTDAARPATESSTDTKAVEVGVKFRSDLEGWITGLRFYKGSRNTGTHVGSLWTSTGVLLARATFAGESTTGWQQVTFATPVHVSADTTYVASYHAPVGGWAVTAPYFVSTYVNQPLRALRDGLDGGNGVFRYNATPVFPNQTNKSSNYWVDVVFVESPP